MNSFVNNLKNEKERVKIALISTIIFYLFAHGYRFSNNMFSGDSLLMIYQNDYAWQIALGRCFQPIWLFVRGSITSPWLIMFLAMLWTGLSVYFVANLLEIKDKLLLISLSAVMSINVAVTCTNATFLPWSDLFAFALFLAVFGVWLANQKKIILNVVGAFLIALSLGTYQAYICVAIALVMILILRNLYQGKNFSEEWKKVVKFVISFLIAGAVYYICWKICQKVFHIWTSDSYNGLAGLGDYSETSVPQLIALTYKKVIYFLWNPDVFVTLYFREKSLAIIWVYILRIMNVFVCAFIGIMLIMLNRKNKTKIWQCILQVVIILLFPLGINIVCLISKGMVHTLMIYAFVFIYVLALVLVGDLTVNRIAINDNVQAINRVTINKNQSDTAIDQSNDNSEKESEKKLETKKEEIKEKIEKKSEDKLEEKLEEKSEEKLEKKTEKNTVIEICRYGLIASLVLLCWVNAIYANQIYLKKQLQEEASKALMNRIVTSIEAMDGYEAGVTKVSIVGSFEQSPEIVTANGFEDLLPYGMGGSSMFYPGTETAMLNYVMNVNINLVRKDEIIVSEINNVDGEIVDAGLTNAEATDIETINAETTNAEQNGISGEENMEFVEEQIREMSLYPSDNSVNYVGDTIVVKISDLY